MPTCRNGAAAELGTHEAPMKEFYKEAYQTLKRAADRLDSMPSSGKANPRFDGTPGSEKGEGQN